jgi:flavin reductase (DIM6/NTAB) family NADH-FMN oxidoreductase RutF
MWGVGTSIEPLEPHPPPHTPDHPASSQNHRPQPQITTLPCPCTQQRFDGASYTFNAAGVPCLDEVGLRVECTLHSELPGGDHVICVGLVYAAPKLKDFTPLVHSRRTFFSLAPEPIDV